MTAITSQGPPTCARVRLTIRGAVQGVGFRPFVYGLAQELGLRGWVRNSPGGVVTEAEGTPADLDAFALRLQQEAPVNAHIYSLESTVVQPSNRTAPYSGFEILSSDAGPADTVVLPDIATCDACLGEMHDAEDRRYQYPFINCTHCGPRYSIVESIPYDRPNTTMRAFEMCDACREEYEDPANRRFHAQPIACPDCGPQLALWNPAGKMEANRHEALCRAADLLREGAIVALKGIGGFQLLAAASNEDAVQALRQRKGRDEKPFAVMFHALDLVREFCDVSTAEARLLNSPEAPIVLLRRLRENQAGSLIAPGVAPGNPMLGVMLPYSPLHHLLMEQLCMPVVATSGNISDEPICIDEQEALERLRGVADHFLVHDRPITRQVDDSVVRCVNGQVMVLRRARGYAPLPVYLKQPQQAVLAVGAHLKNSIAASCGNRVTLSQHIGDLETPQAIDAFRRVTRDLSLLMHHQPDLVACDLHPDYISTRQARELSDRPVAVQHHVAHVLACMAENHVTEPCLGFSWDGTGYGTDGTVWGGECFTVKDSRVQRVATLRRFRLPGSEIAVREPRRSALGILSEIYGEDTAQCPAAQTLSAFAPVEITNLLRMLHSGLNAPETTSMGRLFDAVASLIGVRQQNAFEGQAAMALEHAIDQAPTRRHYRMTQAPNPVTGILTWDWEPLIRGILDDLAAGESTALISAMFHNTLVEEMIATAKNVGLHHVALSGGCFQNAYLVERAVNRLKEESFEPVLHQSVPPNDGGIALGQVVAAGMSDYVLDT